MFRKYRNPSSSSPGLHKIVLGRGFRRYRRLSSNSPDAMASNVVHRFRRYGNPGSSSPYCIKTKREFWFRRYGKSSSSSPYSRKTLNRPCFGGTVNQAVVHLMPRSRRRRGGFGKYRNPSSSSPLEEWF